MNARDHVREPAGTRSTTTLQPLPARSACGFGLPRTLTSLVGRGSDIDTVLELTGRHDLVSLTGTGGVGKTRVALEVARRTVAGGIDAYWIDVAPSTDADGLCTSLLARLGITDMRDRSARWAVADQIGARRALLVLDNCEHLLDAVGDLVDDVLAAGPGVSVLLTSREPLGIPGETVWRVPSLPFDGTSVELFLQRAVESGGDVGDDLSTMQAVAAICARLDGIPLAIELAAARCRHLSPAAINDALSDRFRLLTGGSRTAVARHRTMRMSMDWSYRLLDEREQRALRSLSVFRDRFSLDAACAVVGAVHAEPASAVTELTGRLVDKNMVAFDGDTYHVLDTVRAYATELMVADELVASRDAHAAWCRTWAQSVVTQRDKRAVDRQLSEYEPDLVAAIEWSMRDPLRAAALVRLLAGFWYRTCRAGDVERLGLGAVAALDADDDAWIATVCALAFPAIAAGLDEFLDGELTRAVEMAEQRGLHAATAIGRNALAFRHQTWEHGAAALRAAQASGNDVAVARAAAQLYIIGLATVDPRTEADSLAALAHWPCALSSAEGESMSIGHAYADYVAGGLRAAADGFAALVAQAEPDPTIAMTGSVGLWLVGLLMVDGEVLASGHRAARSAVEHHRALPVMEENLRFATHPSCPPPSVDVLVHPFQALWRNVGALALVDVGHPAEAIDLLARQPRAVAPGSYLSVADGGVRAAIAHLSDDAEVERRWREVLHGAERGGFLLLAVDALEALAARSAREPRVAGRLLGAAESLRVTTGYRHRFAFQQEWYDSAAAVADAASRAEGAAAEWRTIAEWARRRWGDRNRPTVGWASLTPTELLVVELVGCGMTNPQIAERLLMSRSTVKTHLVHVFDKLGVRSRTELAAAHAHREAGRH